MKKSILCGLLTALCLSAAFAGDVATFVDKGFSEDGKYYVFGQYGKTDKNFQGWAEIYQVDINKNDWVAEGVFKTNPSAVTADKSGLDVYEALEAKSYIYFKDLKMEPANADHVLYILDDVNKTGTDEIVFKDFRGSKLDSPVSYHINLIPTVTGSGKDLRSSFYINLEKKDADGNVLMTKKIGNPDITRRGVLGYKIERIFLDKTEKSLIFVIEKTIDDEKGPSIRYMVEAAKF